MIFLVLVLSAPPRPALAQQAPAVAFGFAQVGEASYYASAYRGRRTAGGERHDPADLTAAHPFLPFGTLVEVTRRDTGRSVVVVVNDRLPRGGRIIDLSQAAARALGMLGRGTATVEVAAIGRAG